MDGTLLNAQKELSEYTQHKLNLLIQRGLHFSIATARTTVSVTKIMSTAHMNMPVILMNGALIYDLVAKQYLKIETLAESTVRAIISLLRKYKLYGFMYAVSGKRLITYYEKLDTTFLQNYYQERVERYGKTFDCIADFSDNIRQDYVVYLTLMDEKRKLLGVVDELKFLSDIDMVLSHDVYTENLWYLEIYSKQASKYNAVSYLRNRYDFTKVIGFGDNFNDIPLFKACDEFYAVGNAIDELKNIATGVIETNVKNGVTNFILEREGSFNQECEESQD
ncbi:haloacid dehalogenase [Sporomusaceae bacterium FL31]|nr:haloacid dehalogenase [Sporomusaceae bacterium FL31]GCE32325.1 haloacid dehalogenase [Sporomusaceae bacterium]